MTAAPTTCSMQSAASAAAATDNSSSQLFARRCFDGTRWHQSVLLELRDGLIHSMTPWSAPLSADTASPAEIQPPAGVMSVACLVPGFVDVQVNGGGGVLLNQQPDLATLKTMSAAHLQFGTTAMLPTVITDSLAVMQQAADAVAALLAAEPPAGPATGLATGHVGHSIVGIHFEGPHLSKAKPGIHPKQQIRPLSDAELQLFCRQDLGLVMVTLAPETVSPAQIRQLCQHGVIVSLGHSNASFEQAMAAVAAGASGFTHLMNAMSPLTSREPGMVGAALAAANNASGPSSNISENSPAKTFAGLIVDHHHLHPASARLMAQLLGMERLVLVTDAMAHTGSPLQQLPYDDTLIERRPAGCGLGGLAGSDKLCLPDGTLAGSALDMQSALQHLVRDLQLPLELGLAACSRNPARWLHPNLADTALPFGVIRPGARADLLALADNWLGLSDNQLALSNDFLAQADDLTIEHIWLAGQLVTAAPSVIPAAAVSAAVISTAVSTSLPTAVSADLIAKDLI